MENDTYNMEELAQQFTLEVNPGNLKNGMKANGATSNDLWRYPVKNLRIIEGFNVRVRNADFFARRRRYANAMKKDGYWPHKPMAGYIGRDKETGEECFFLTAGYTRREAIDLANSELPKDEQIEFVTVVAHSAKGLTKSKLNALLITENESGELNPYEASIVCKRMLDDGDSIETIAAETNYSTEWVDSLLKLAVAPIELQRMVVDDVIKPTFAIEVLKEHGGEKALALLKEALARKTGGSEEPAADTEAETAEDGEEVAGRKKVRVTAKDLTSPEVRKFQNAVRREAPAMYQALSGVTADPAFTSLAPETRELLLGMMGKLKKHEVQNGEPVVDPRQTALFEGGEASAAPSASTDAAAN